MRPDWREVPRGDISPQMSGMYVTMNPKGLIAMSRYTYEQMGAPKAFVVLFDTVNNRIGLRPAAPTTRNAYPVRRHSGSGAKKILVYRMTQEYKIDLPQTIRFHDAEMDEDGVLILDLRTARISTRTWSERRKMENGQWTMGSSKQ